MAQDIQETFFKHLLLYLGGHWASTTSAAALGVRSPSGKKSNIKNYCVQLSVSNARKNWLWRKSWEHISKSPREAQIKISAGSLQAPRSLYKHSVSVNSLQCWLTLLGDQVFSSKQEPVIIYEISTQLLYKRSLGLRWGRCLALLKQEPLLKNPN